MTNRLIRRVLSVLLTSVILFCTIGGAHAEDISGYQTDFTTGWAKIDTPIHREQKSSTYTYASSEIKSAYASYVTAGISKWGSYISCTESTSSPVGTITVSILDSGANAVTSIPVDCPNNHIYTWTITIYINNFDQNSTNGKSNTIAHEIGHAYGLNHVSKASHIMYGEYSDTKRVTSSDLAGMSVMTHSHSHSSTYDKTYEYSSGHQHKRRCTTCKAFTYGACANTNYHSGNLHYYVFDCVCGNQTTESYACSGPPCSILYSLEPVESTE